MYKILFVKPHQRKKGPQAIELPLAFLYLSSYLKKYLDESVQVELIDLRLTKRPRHTLINKIQAFKPDLIGLSLVAADEAFLEQYAGVFKTHCPEAVVVIGGPCATYGHEDLLLAHREVDYAVVGEGEVPFLNLVKALIRKEDTRQVKGLAYVAGGAVIANEPEAYLANLDDLPLPDYSLVDLPRYWATISKTMNGVLAEKRYTHVMSSRGCPYQCIYCHNMFGKKVRVRSPENFVAEIEWLYDRYGIREFHIIDDIFNIDRKRMHTILDLIIATGKKVKIAFPNGVRGDLLEKEDILLMKQAGVYMLTVAVETASPRLQKVVRKNLDIPKVLENIGHAKRAGLLIRGFFMLGFPGETVEEIKTTIQWAVASPLDLASFFTVVPFKNTGLADLAEKVSPAAVARSNEEGGWYWHARPFYQRATGYNLKQAQRYAYMKFYLPFRLIRTFFKLPMKSFVFLWLLYAWQLWGPLDEKWGDEI